MNPIDDFLENVVALLVEHGREVAKYPDKLLHMKFRAVQARNCRWEFFCNGNSTPRKVEAEQWGELELEPYNFAIFWNGWLAGLLSPRGGQMAIHPVGANAETFLDALQAHLEKMESLKNESNTEPSLS